MDNGGPCMVQVGYGVHVLIAAMQAFTAIMVAWLTTRAKRRDRKERQREFDESNGQ